jgi:hemoglobin
VEGDVPKVSGVSDAPPQEAPWFEQLGGAPVVARLVARFYDLMDRPEVAALRGLHATSLAMSREKLTLYLTGWLGGPQLYIERYGHPRLRARHLPFAIGALEAAQWMDCMRLAMAEVVVDARLRGEMDGALARLAGHMINQPG